MRGDLLENGALRQPLDRRHRRVLELTVHRDRDDLAAILQRVERRHSDRIERGVPRDDAKRVLIVHAHERAAGHLFAKRPLGDERERLDVAKRGQRLDRREAFGLRHTFKGIECEVAQHRPRLVPHAQIGVGERHSRQCVGVHQLGHGRTTDPCVFVLARNFGQQIAFVDRHLLNERETNGRIGMRLTGLRAESVEQGHGQPHRGRGDILVKRMPLGVHVLEAPKVVLQFDGSRSLF